MDRIEKLVANLPSGIDAAIITSAINRRYYTGFPSSAGTILATKDKAYFIIDSRYVEAARQQAKGCEIILQGDVYAQLNDLIKKHNIKTAAIEADTLTVTEFETFKNKLNSTEILNGGLSGIIANQRMIKSDEEIACVQAAQDISDKVFDHILNFIKVGLTEREIALEMETASKRFGSEENAFAYIIAAGSNSSRPHAVPGDNKVKDGDFIVMDYGATVNGYRSDMTRTVGVGNISDKQKEVYNIVLKAQLESLKAIKAGVCCKDVDKVARDIIDATEYKGLFGHGLGHSLGLEVHENPRFSPLCGDIAQENILMSVEPGIYIEGEFGVRIEDIVVVTKDGYRNFVNSPKELIVL